jgi:phenylacetate-coenzyme A ligase PaaK-like adenylate-forming protein
MKRTNLDSWIENIEGISYLTRENLEQLQLCRLNETLKRLKDRGGFYKDYPEALRRLEELHD